jgi:transcriptional regulator with GAF, ATPase, and Fis domain
VSAAGGPAEVRPFVAAEIAAELARAEDQPGLGGWLQRLCRAAARTLPASGVGVSLISGHDGAATVVAASGTDAEVIEELQFTLGEGPCQDAYALGRPVLAADLAEAARARWPGYAPAAQEHGVEAVFAFPLLIGAARLGAMDVYRAHTGSLSAQAVRQALAFAAAATAALLDAQEKAQDGDEDEDTLGLEEGLSGYVVYQAQGMIHVQLGISLSQAMARLRAYAYAHDRSLSEVAADVVARRLVLEGDS